MKLDLQLAEEKRFRVLFSRNDHEPAKLNALYTAARALRDEHEDTILELKAEKEVGLTLLVNPSRLAFTLAHLLTEKG